MYFVRHKSFVGQVVVGASDGWRWCFRKITQYRKELYHPLHFQASRTSTIGIDDGSTHLLLVLEQREVNGALEGLAIHHLPVSAYVRGDCLEPLLGRGIRVKSGW